jgi:preprotein translocase subunit SecY
MKNTILIIYVLVSSGAILLLDSSLREAQGNIETIAEVLQRHGSALEGHRSAITIILESIRGLYT